MDPEMRIINIVFVVQRTVAAKAVCILGIFIIAPVSSNVVLIIPRPPIHQYRNGELRVLGIHRLDSNIGFIGFRWIRGKKSHIGCQDSGKTGAQGITNGGYNGEMIFSRNL